MSVNDFSFGNLENSLSPEEFAQFQSLNAEWNRLFPSFQNFDFNAFSNNLGGSRDKIMSNIAQVGNDSQGHQNARDKAAILKRMNEFFGNRQAFGGQFPKIDDATISGLFDPLRQGVDASADALRTQTTGDINRAAAGATERSTEALAGTGLGRSGVAATNLSGIESQRATQTAGAMAQIESARQQQIAQIQGQEVNFRIQQELSEQGFDVDSIRSVQAFNQQLMLMNFEARLNFDPGSWLDTFGEIVDIGVGVTALALAPSTGGASLGFLAAKR